MPSGKILTNCVLMAIDFIAAKENHLRQQASRTMVILETHWNHYETLHHAPNMVTHGTTHHMSAYKAEDITLSVNTQGDSSSVSMWNIILTYSLSAYWVGPQTTSETMWWPVRQLGPRAQPATTKREWKFWRNYSPRRMSASGKLQRNYGREAACPNARARSHEKNVEGI
jgi:hypothetical protein